MLMKNIDNGGFMKNVFTALAVIVLFLASITATWAVSGYPGKMRVKNTTLTSGGTIYEIVIPAGTGAIQMQSRTAADFKISNLSDASVYYTVKSGSVFSVSPLAVDQTIYATSASAGQVIETTYWQ